MAELLPQERLQPSLLDRLADDDPGSQQESREQRVLSVRRLRESVKRDLSWLFNATNLTTVLNLDDYPQVKRSVLNYGIPEMSGRLISSLDPIDLERMIKQAVLDFEPRIIANTVTVKLSLDTDEMNRNALMFEIEGDLWAQPVPLQLYLKTEIDLDLGEVNVLEYGAH